MSQTRNTSQPLHIVLGASGGAGLAILQELISQGKNAVGVNSSGKIPTGVNAEFKKADALNKNELMKACQGASFIYHAINVPYQQWSEKLIPMMENVISTAKDNNAKLVYIDNLYAYGPVEKPMTEDMPNDATDTKGILRGKLVDKLIKSYDQAVIIRGSDFYGANIQGHLADLVFKNILSDKPSQIIGDINKLHTYTYIKDFAKATVFLAEKPQAYGQVWQAPNAQTVSTKAMLDEIYKQAGKTPKIQGLNGILFNILSLFSPILRELKPLYYQRDRDYVVDSSKFETAFGKFHTTPYKIAIAETWEWYKSRK